MFRAPSSRRHRRGSGALHWRLDCSGGPVPPVHIAASSPQRSNQSPAPNPVALPARRVHEDSTGLQGRKTANARAGRDLPHAFLRGFGDDHRPAQARSQAQNRRGFSTAPVYRTSTGRSRRSGGPGHHGHGRRSQPCRGSRLMLCCVGLRGGGRCPPVPGRLIESVRESLFGQSRPQVGREHRARGASNGNGVSAHSAGRRPHPDGGDPHRAVADRLRLHDFSVLPAAEGTGRHQPGRGAASFRLPRWSGSAS